MSLTNQVDGRTCPLRPLQTGRACVKFFLLFQIYFTAKKLFTIAA
jgi:hypothetical protein